MAEAAAAQLFTRVPELMKEGISTAKELKDAFDGVLGLKQYAETLEKIVDTMSKVNDQLEEKNKEIAEKFTIAHNESHAALLQADTVIKVIKKQTENFIRVVETPGIPAAVHIDVFLTFLTEIQPVVDKASKDLQTARGSLTVAINRVPNLLTNLEALKNKAINEQKRAEATQRAESYGWAAVGVLFGPVGLVVSYSIAAGVTEGCLIENIEKAFEKQKSLMDGYKSDFESMKNNAEALKTKIDGKANHLQTVNVELGGLRGTVKDMSKYPACMALILEDAIKLRDACNAER